ncbi:MAG: hypothetical protein HYY15_04325 [Candidatus Omnitrophica bacterium]|nr:hypothetical protein [Candidatus Omnitrophota bacterium]
MTQAWQRIIIGLIVSCAAAAAQASELVIYGFEGNAEGWSVPDWAKTSADYGVTEIAPSTTQAKEGASALELRVDLPGGQWSGAYIERQVEVTDWTPFSRLVVSIYLPDDAPTGLTGRFILTVGEGWTWTEMNRALPLSPGEWTELAVNLKPGSMDWKFFPDEEFRKSVRKIGIRIESDKEPAYHGSVFVDNVRVME